MISYSFFKTRFLYFISLIGASVGFIVWALTAWLNYLFPYFSLPFIKMRINITVLDTVLLGLLIGGANLFFAMLKAEYPNKFLKILKGGCFGALAGLLSYVFFLMIPHIEDSLNTTWIMPMLTWLITGFALGFSIGLGKYGLFSLAFRCAIFGAIGGVVGAGVLIAAGKLFTYLPDPLPSALGLMPSALGLMAIGAGICGGAEKAIEIRRKAFLVYQGGNDFFQLGFSKEIFPKQELIIGNDAQRNGQNFFHIPDLHIRKEHFELYETEGLIKVRVGASDTTGSNGHILQVLLNKQSLHNDTVLKHGDKLKIGGAIFEIIYPNAEKTHKR